VTFVFMNNGVFILMIYGHSGLILTVHLLLGALTGVHPVGELVAGGGARFTEGGVGLPSHPRPAVVQRQAGGAQVVCQDQPRMSINHQVKKSIIHQQKSPL